MRCEVKHDAARRHQAEARRKAAHLDVLANAGACRGVAPRTCRLCPAGDGCCGRGRKRNSWWSVSAWPRDSAQALVGVRAAGVVSRKGKPFDLTFQGKAIHLTSAGTVQTGAAEDSRVYISLKDFESWTDIQPSTIE